jgi:hypothetical protein
MTHRTVDKHVPAPKIICVPYREQLDSCKQVLDVTSNIHSPFSPSYLETEYGLLENIWQYSKVYPPHVDEHGNLKEEWYDWRAAGFLSPTVLPHPVENSVQPLFIMWKDKKFSTIEARKKMYIPLYTKAVLQNAKKEFQTLVGMWNSLQDSLENLYLKDFNGYNRHQYHMTFNDVVRCTTRNMGHSFVLEHMILSA